MRLSVRISIKSIMDMREILVNDHEGNENGP